MIKRIILFFTLIFYFSSAHADFWSDVAACFSNPCNCGYGKRYERWMGQVLDKGDQNPLCPPWNKEAGRDDNTCLVQYQYPPIFTQYFELVCAEATNESNYFSPKIRIRNQACNSIACWSTVSTLNWDGQCVTLASPYGIPLTRMCARVAIPADPTTGTSADPGYTPKQHLNTEGARLSDDPILDSNGNVLDVNPPKLCAYLDPAFIGTGSQGVDVDFLDLDPNRQTFHKTSDLHPVVKVMIFFIDIATQAAQAPAQLISGLISMIANGTGGETTVSKTLGAMFESVSWLMEFFANIVTSMLKSIGQINRVVSTNNYGCVDIPMGPFPPPCCPTLNPLSQLAFVQRICETGSNGLPVASTSAKECVVSKLRNNFIYNSIRITFDNFVPLCKNGENPLQTDKCVTIDNLSSFSVATAMHIVTAKRDVLKPCNKAAPGEPCVRSKTPHTCSVTQNGCEDGFRVVYGVKVKNQITPKPYYRDDLANCDGSNATVVCQDIWGVNLGEFVDVPLQFPSVQNPSDILPIAQTVSLKSKAGNTVTFNASIVRNSVDNTTFNFRQTPRSMCVFDPNRLVGCIDRAPFVKPNVYSCSSNFGGLSCTSDYFQPKLIISGQSGSDVTNAVVTPLSTYSTSTGVVSYSSVNIGGINFDSFVTDDTEIKKPFSGTKSPTPSSVYGNYKNNASPLNPDGTANTSAVYLNGLEYINGKYFRGGTQVCLEQTNTDKCPTDTTKCVLTNLQNRDLVSCKTYFQKLPLYQGLQLCDATFTSCTDVESIPKKTGTGAGITIRKCNSGTKYCYTSANSQAVCVVTNILAHRQTPNTSYGKVIPDSQFYDINGSPGLSYDQDLYALRDKTAYEQNLCVAIPQPTCASVIEANATWPSVAVGALSTGTCQVGFSVGSVMQRYCLVNSNNKTFFLETLPNMGCTSVDPNATSTSGGGLIGGGSGPSLGGSSPFGP